MVKEESLEERILGNKSERREASDYFYMFTTFLLINAVVHFFSLTGHSSEIITLVVNISLNCRLLALAITIVLLFKLKAYSLNEVEKSSILKKGNLLFIINLLLLFYALVITRKTGSSLTSTSAFNMLFFSVSMTVAWVTDKLLNTNRQTAWQKVVGNYEENEDKRNFLWRFKLDFTHLDKSISRKDLLEAYSNWCLLYLVFFVIGLISFTKGFRYYNLISLTFLILIFARPLLFILDLIFNLSASLEGECIGFYTHSKKNSSRYTYTYIVTNYKRKIEVRFTTEEEQFFQEGELVKIYYTLLSRRILKSHKISYLEDN